MTGWGCAGPWWPWWSVGGVLHLAHHARARRGRVAVAVEDGEIAITIEDDGAGFDAAALGGRGGLGLSGIAERARILGGRSAIRSSPGQGTTVSVHLPRKSGEEIAEELTVHYRTVENHRTSMAGKLGLVGSHALSRYAAQHRDRLN